MNREAENLPAGLDRDAIAECGARLRHRAPKGPRRDDFRDVAPLREGGDHE